MAEREISRSESSLLSEAVNPPTVGESLRWGQRHAKVSAAMRQKVGFGRLAGVVLAAGLFGCGRPATRAECDEIFDKSAELELRSQNVTDPAEITKRTAAVRAARGEELVGKCVGRRITQRALECVRKASTAEQVDRCLD
jgi:hypothetical protein